MFGSANSPFVALLERLTMARHKSPTGTGKATTDPQPSTMPTPTKPKSLSPVPASPRSPRNPANKVWLQEQQRRIFLKHLAQWGLDHDSSLHFHGRLSLASPGNGHGESIELGKAVKCVLTDTTLKDARQTVVVKLFPPQGYTSLEERDHEDIRRDSMELIGSGSQSDQGTIITSQIRGKTKQDSTRSVKGRYRLVVRCGAGWISAREYLSKVYISRLELQRGTRARWLEHDEHLARRSRSLGPVASEQDSVTIRPLFHAFKKLPSELQEMILVAAAGLSRSCDLRSDDYGTLVQPKKDRAAISLSTLFRISKRITEHLQPFIYHSTDFHFGLTGFTNFLWQSGPEKRHEIRRLTFHFGRLALLHCIRWLAPDPIFELFEPPVATNPRSLQYFWRCQIQDLAKELHLITLTIDIKHIIKSELPMMIAIMRSTFGSIHKLQFVEVDNSGATKIVDMDDERLSGLRREYTWREMCLQYFHTHRAPHQYFFKFELAKWQVDDLEDVMAKNRKFFYTPFSPLAPKGEFPVSE